MIRFIILCSLLSLTRGQGLPMDDEAVERCVERMKEKPMMVKFFSDARMRAICRRQLEHADRVNGMSRQDQQAKMDGMSPEVRGFMSSLGQIRPQSLKALDVQTTEMEEGTVMCLKKMEKEDMMMKMFTHEQMEGVCHNEVSWAMKVQEAQKLDPTMTAKVKSMSQPVRDYFNSLGQESASRRSSRATPRPRKEYRMLTAEERQNFHDAINAMKNTPVGETNEYDVFIMYHETTVSPGAHWGASFLGWHREYVIRMERALQRHNPSVMVPYWDSTLDNNLGDFANMSIMWTESFMGTARGDVVEGPFANWETPRPTYGRHGLWRAGGSWSNGSFYTEEQVDQIISINEFRDNTFHVSALVEGAHGGPHLWVGGPMGNIENSPSDPVFWIHHGFVDMIWELQQQRVFGEGRRDQYVYPNASDHEAYGVGVNQITPNIVIDDPEESYHFITNPMLPYDHLINADGHRDTYRLLYRYEDRPSCSSQNPTCGSPYLFCIDEVYKCAPKLQLGANCQEFESSDSCFEGICDNGVCSSIPKCQ